MGVASKFFAQFPVIGPHYNIEAELLLNGTKPLGWISILRDTADPTFPAIAKARALEAQLTEAVAEGRLVSKDVIVPMTDGTGKVHQDIYRHYCQPGREADLEKMAAFNQAGFNRQNTDIKLDKDFGEYLGYRQRDQMYFKVVQDMGRHLPRTLMDALYSFNEKVTQPAYQAEALKQKAPAVKAPKL